MKKKILNNKGYMLVEIIVASVIAMVMAYFLMDITVKFVDKNNDYYVDSLLLTDKALITKEIMDDIVSKGLKDVRDDFMYDADYYVQLCFDEYCSDYKFLSFDKDNKKIKYANEIIGYEYTKTLSDELTIDEDNIKFTKDASILTIDIPAYTNYSKENYGIKIVVPYG